MIKLTIFYAMLGNWQMDTLVFPDHVTCNQVEQSIRLPKMNIKYTHVQHVFEHGGGRPLFFIPYRS